MEPVGVLHNEDCDFLNKMFSADEEADFAFQFLQGFGTWPTNEANLNANANFAVFDENLFTSSGNFDTNFFPSQENTNISIDSNNYTACFPNLSHENVQFSEPNLIPMMNDISDSMNFCDMDGQTNALAHRFSNVHGMQDLRLKEETGNADITDSSIKWKSEVPQKLKAVEDVKLTIESVENLKKRCGPKDSPKCKKNVQQKRRKGVTQNVMNNEDINYNGRNGQSSSSYSSEDDSNASQELNGGATSDSKALNSSGKPRAGRGAATDPQSLYARKRREKINERLRILQNLVPNGTKVDISTMLEEAVQYVKFLQLQIKLLSSDEMWMYAPIAYNGMDMGLYQKISPTL